MDEYLAIDPGAHKNRRGKAGWCLLDDEGEPQEFGQVNEDEFDKWLMSFLKEHPNIKLIICENYRVAHWNNQKWKANAGSKVETAKQIGSIETIARLHDVKVVLQEPSVYPMGAMYGGFEIPTNHSISHQWVAAAHGIYYLQQQGIRKPRIPE